LVSVFITAGDNNGFASDIQLASAVRSDGFKELKNILIRNLMVHIDAADGDLCFRAC